MNLLLQDNQIADFDNLSKKKVSFQRPIFYFFIISFLFLFFYYLFFSAPIDFPKGIVVSIEKGENLRKYGNCINILVPLEDGRKVVSFPVKHNWHETADIELIIRSCREAMCRTANYPEEKFLLPRPGCGNGGLSWEDVKPMIEPILDDRFYIVHFKEEK